MHPVAWAGLLGGWYLVECLYEAQERRDVFALARATADWYGKPLLNIACGSGWRELSEAADVNVDIVPRPVPQFLQADIHDLWMFEDRYFGAAFCSHTMEHLQDPGQARAELDRVSEVVFVVTPLPIFPAAWVSPDHRWVFGPGQSWVIRNWPQLFVPAQPHPARQGGRMILKRAA